MSFQFYTGLRLVELTGRKARTLPQLIEHLRQVSGSCVFYHTHQRYLTHHFREPGYYNDFTEWCARSLQEPAVAEKLAAVDLLDFTSLDDLRAALIAAVESAPQLRSAQPRVCPPGDEFHFCKVKSFIIPTGMKADNLEEFTVHLARCTNSSILFHLFEARLRLERRTNDFSLWLRDHGEPELAEEIDRLDPYVMSLDELRDEIRALCRRRLAEES